jgi:hypothetical protein
MLEKAAIVFLIVLLVSILAAIIVGINDKDGR